MMVTWKFVNISPIQFESYNLSVMFFFKETFYTLHTNAHERENATKSKGEIQIYKADLFKFFIKKKLLSSST